MTLEDKFRHKAQELRGRIKRNAGPGDAQPDDDHVDVVGQVGDSVSDEAWRRHGASTREISTRASA